MANRCAGLDPTWTHLPAPAPARAAAGHCHSTSSSWLVFPAAAFENEALTSALRASMSPAAANASPSSSYPTTPTSSSTSSASELLSGGNDAPAPASRPGPLARSALAGPKAGRVTKRKPRPSRRPPVTYITADPANFRRMVQDITGHPVIASSFGVRHPQATTASEPAPSWHAAQPACTLPTLDTSAFLLDRAVAAGPAPGRPDDKSSSGGAPPAMAVAAAAAVVEEDDGDSSMLQELEAMACAPAFVSESDFPTLESWGII